MCDLVKTNIGEMPFEDYCEIVAIQHGFDSYAEMQEEGLCILDEKERKQ